MTAASATLPGLERIQQRFCDMMVDRRAAIAGHVMAAWEAPSGSPDSVGHIKAACDILHVIAGSAGTLGLTEVGDAARTAELAILADTDEGAGPISADVIHAVSDFLAQSEKLLANKV